MTDAHGVRPTRVLLCIGGGIAAYKTPELIRELIAHDMDVRVVVTPAATAFVTELSLAVVSRHPVRSEVLDPAQEGQIGHIELADWADVVLVAPATADLLARAAVGMADDLVTLCLLATAAPVVWAPAMNTNMWGHPATQHNLAILRQRGASFIGPDTGELACGWTGPGRMMDPPRIAAAVAAAAGQPGSWAGRKVLISAGPTRTYLDPVRFLTNASTGIMGFAIAAAAARQAAEVTLVAGPVEQPTPAGVHRVDVETAEQMLAAMDAQLAAGSTDLVIMSAAVSDLALDLRPDLATSPGAHHKLDKATLLDQLRQAPWREGIDVLATLVARHGSTTRFLGFAAQTAQGTAEEIRATLLAAARDKMGRKGVGALFVNRVAVPDQGFASPTNTGLLLTNAGGHTHVEDAGAPMPKAQLAQWLLEHLRGWLTLP